MSGGGPKTRRVVVDGEGRRVGGVGRLGVSAGTRRPDVDKDDVMLSSRDEGDEVEREKAGRVETHVAELIGAREGVSDVDSCSDVVGGRSSSMTVGVSSSVSRRVCISR